MSHIENNGMMCFDICIKEAEVHLLVGILLCKTEARRESKNNKNMFINPTGKSWRSSSRIH